MGENQKMPNKSYASVWDAIEDTPAQAELMRQKSGLMMSLQDLIRASGMQQEAAARAMNATQEQISGLMTGKISQFTLDTMLAMAVAFGARVSIELTPDPAPAVEAAKARS